MYRGRCAESARRSFAEAGRRVVNVFAEKQLSATGDGRGVTRDPFEIVEGPCNPPLSSEAFRLR